jgi:hypothetical protein
MSYITTANLRILADFLKANTELVEDHLDMSDFCSYTCIPSDYRAALANGCISLDPHSDCGTTLCLAGWAATIPELYSQVENTTSYRQFVDAVFSKSGPMFDYLFGQFWENSVQYGIQRIERLILAVETEDNEFIDYMNRHANDIHQIHGAADEEDAEAECGYCINRMSLVKRNAVRQYATLKDAFPVLEVPDWFKESA